MAYFNGREILLAGLKGDSAYSIAVRNGFVGTESEWIAYISGIPILSDKGSLVYLRTPSLSEDGTLYF